MKTVPQYLYKPNYDGTFDIVSYVYCAETTTEFRNYVSTELTEMDAINRIIKLMGIA